MTMSFRDNLQHLRATRNMTQEQLAMLLGVSRQSVSKWEAERAYPEMDKLIKICDIFGCTLDELVSDDLTSRATDSSQSVPAGTPPQDITGYDEAMTRFATRIPAGVASILVGCALTALLAGPDPVPKPLIAIPFLLFLVIGLSLLIPAGMDYDAFRKSHPFVEDFYTDEQRASARSTLSRCLVAGIAMFLAAFMLGLHDLDQDTFYGPLACTATLLVAAGVWLIVRGAMMNGRMDVAEYNDDSLAGLSDDAIDALPDETSRGRARHVKRTSDIETVVMLVATVVGLALLFIPALHAQAWFWISWVVGGIACGGIEAVKG